MFELRVLNGLHEGATLPLSGEAWELGNDEQRDLQLCDTSIQSLHASLARVQDNWQLTPNEGEVFLTYGQPITESLSLEVNQPFQLSGVWLVVSEAGEPWESTSLIPVTPEGVIAKPKLKLTRKSKGLPSWFKPSVVMLIILGVVVLFSWLFSAPATEETTLSKPVIYDSEGLRSVFADKLEERGLQKAVRILSNQYGVTLAGEVTETEKGIIRRLLVSMKNDYDIRVGMQDATTLKKLMLPFRLVQITAGKHANVVINTGKRYFIGDQIGDFTLSKITNKTVEFTGKQNITVNW